jgi:uncharacterized membrane protein YdjX (TVP38/TMEM64 family)
MPILEERRRKCRSCTFSPPKVPSMACSGTTFSLLYFALMSVVGLLTSFVIYVIFSSYVGYVMLSEEGCGRKMA